MTFFLVIDLFCVLYMGGGQIRSRPYFSTKSQYFHCSFCPERGGPNSIANLPISMGAMAGFAPWIRHCPGDIELFRWLIRSITLFLVFLCYHLSRGKAFALIKQHKLPWILISYYLWLIDNCNGIALLWHQCLVHKTWSAVRQIPQFMSCLCELCIGVK